MIAISLPAIDAAKAAAQRTQCINNLKIIGVALNNYHDVYGCFPSPSIAGSNGKRMHSWRVAVRAFMESSTFYERYDFSRPWNSPTNLSLAREWVSHFNHYACPSASQPQGAGFTNYVMDVGPEAASRPGEWMSLDRITDGPAKTIIVAEIADSDIFWSEPRDLSFDEISLWINDKPKTCISSHHPHGAMVVFADGSVMFLDESTSPDCLRAMLTSAADD